ncbi:predicted protein, partial [Nematostella vectensis]
RAFMDAISVDTSLNDVNVKSGTPRLDVPKVTEETEPLAYKVQEDRRGLDAIVGDTISKDMDDMSTDSQATYETKPLVYSVQAKQDFEDEVGEELQIFHINPGSIVVTELPPSPQEPNVTQTLSSALGVSSFTENASVNVSSTNDKRLSPELGVSETIQAVSAEDKLKLPRRLLPKDGLARELNFSGKLQQTANDHPTRLLSPNAHGNTGYDQGSSITNKSYQNNPKRTQEVHDEASIKIPTKTFANGQQDIAFSTCTASPSGESRPEDTRNDNPANYVPPWELPLPPSGLPLPLPRLPLPPLRLPPPHSRLPLPPPKLPPPSRIPLPSKLSTNKDIKFHPYHNVVSSTKFATTDRILPEFNVGISSPMPQAYQTKQGVGSRYVSMDKGKEKATRCESSSRCYKPVKERSHGADLEFIDLNAQKYTTLAVGCPDNSQATNPRGSGTHGRFGKQYTSLVAEWSDVSETSAVLGNTFKNGAKDGEVLGNNSDNRAVEKSKKSLMNHKRFSCVEKLRSLGLSPCIPVIRLEDIKYKLQKNGKSTFVYDSVALQRKQAQLSPSALQLSNLSLPPYANENRDHCSLNFPFDHTTIAKDLFAKFPNVLNAPEQEPLIRSSVSSMDNLYHLLTNDMYAPGPSTDDPTSKPTHARSVATSSAGSGWSQPYTSSGVTHSQYWDPGVCLPEFNRKEVHTVSSLSCQTTSTTLVDFSESYRSTVSESEKENASNNGSYASDTVGPGPEKQKKEGIPQAYVEFLVAGEPIPFEDSLQKDKYLCEISKEPKIIEKDLPDIFGDISCLGNKREREIGKGPSRSKVLEERNKTLLTLQRKLESQTAEINYSSSAIARKNPTAENRALESQYPEKINTSAERTEKTPLVTSVAEDVIFKDPIIVNVYSLQRAEVKTTQDTERQFLHSASSRSSTANPGQKRRHTGDDVTYTSKVRLENCVNHKDYEREIFLRESRQQQFDTLPKVGKRTESYRSSENNRLYGHHAYKPIVPKPLSLPGNVNYAADQTLKKTLDYLISKPLGLRGNFNHAADQTGQKAPGYSIQNQAVLPGNANHAADLTGPKAPGYSIQNHPDLPVNGNQAADLTGPKAPGYSIQNHPDLPGNANHAADLTGPKAPGYSIQKHPDLPGNGNQAADLTGPKAPGYPILKHPDLPGNGNHAADLTGQKAPGYPIQNHPDLPGNVNHAVVQVRQKELGYPIQKHPGLHSNVNHAADQTSQKAPDYPVSNHIVYQEENNTLYYPVAPSYQERRLPRLEALFNFHSPAAERRKPHPLLRETYRATRSTFTYFASNLLSSTLPIFTKSPEWYQKCFSEDIENANGQHSAKGVITHRYSQGY